MFRVLVFPSVNEPGLEILHALRKSNKVELLAGSSYDLEFDPSRLLARHHLACPALGDPDFRERLEALIREHRVDFVFPTVDSLVAAFPSWETKGTTFIGTNTETANLLLSKRATYQRLANAVPVPHVFDGPNVDFPAFAKPDQGSGSRGGMKVSSELHLSLARHGSLLVHEYLPGEEYTIDCLNDRDGNLLHANPRVRSRIGRGISLGTQSVQRSDLKSYAQRIAGVIRIEGPWFAQFKVARDGIPKLLEVNARVAGSMILTRLAGVNIPLISVFLFAGQRVEIPRQLEGLRINRSLCTFGEIDDFEWVIWDLEDTLIRSDGRPDPEVVGRLYDFSNQGKAQIVVTKHPQPADLMTANRIPDLFLRIWSVVDKPGELAGILQAHSIDPTRAIIINDSVTENLQIQQMIPTLRTVMPDAIGVLATERL